MMLTYDQANEVMRDIAKLIHYAKMEDYNADNKVMAEQYRKLYQQQQAMIHQKLTGDRPIQ
jgi:hypothetical protein